MTERNELERDLGNLRRDIKQIYQEWKSQEKGSLGNLPGEDPTEDQIERVKRLVKDEQLVLVGFRTKCEELLKTLHDLAHLVDKETQ